MVPSQPLIINSQDIKNNLGKTQLLSDIEEIEETLSMDEMERELIEKALKKNKGKRKEAAKELGISERTLYRKIKLYDLED